MNLFKSGSRLFSRGSLLATMFVLCAIASRLINADNNATTQNKTEPEGGKETSQQEDEQEKDWFGTEFKVCLGLAVFVTLAGLVACCVIRAKAKTSHSSERILPKTLVPVPSDTNGYSF